MARQIDSRLILKGQLVAETPLSVGGMGGNGDVDLALAIDGQGRLYVPGTSLAGPLRAWLCARMLDKTKVEKLLGYQKKVKNAQGEDEDKGQASFVIVEDGLVRDTNNRAMPSSNAEVRDGVGIDRRTGAAADRAKYNRAILPNGSRIDFKMTVELANHAESVNSEQAKSLIHALWQALEDGEIRFGASKTRGLGRVKLEAKSECEQTFNNRKGLLDVLRDNPKPPDWGIPDATKQWLKDHLKKPPRLTFEIGWQPVGPLMVKAEADGLAVDMLPLVSAVNDKLALVLPGSSIKGAFRSHAERIVRTVLGTEAEGAFLEQVKVPLIRDLFGEAGMKEQGKKKDLELCPDNFELKPGLSALSIDDCYAKEESGMTRRQWAEIESATNEEGLRTALDLTPLKDTQQAFHVAIDRWLGSAADGFLYTVLEPHGVKWKPIRLTLDLARLPQSLHKPAIACTLFVLRDFVAGRLPLGFGVNRGMGAIEVTGITVTAHDLEGDLMNLKTLRLANRRLKFDDDAIRQTLDAAWQSGEWHKTNQPGADAVATEKEAE